MSATKIHKNAGSYRAEMGRSRSDRESFWLEAAESIDWSNAPSAALDVRSDTEWQWFPKGQLNMCVNALDRHVAAGRGDHTALIFDSAMTDTKTRLSYSELLVEVASFAGALKSRGVSLGDRVLIYMPMTPTAVIAMLACARIGAIHSVVFGGFASNELAVRIEDAKPKVVVTSSGGREPGRTVEYLPLVRAALDIAGGAASGVEAVIVDDREAVPGSAADYAQNSEVSWLDWAELVAEAKPADPVPVSSDHPLYILYTSGTTGSPKGVVRDTGGYAVALAWSMRNIYDVGVGDTMFTASDVG